MAFAAFLYGKSHAEGSSAGHSIPENALASFLDKLPEDFRALVVRSEGALDSFLGRSAVRAQLFCGDLKHHERIDRQIHIDLAVFERGLLRRT